MVLLEDMESSIGMLILDDTQYYKVFREQGHLAQFNNFRAFLSSIAIY